MTDGGICEYMHLFTCDAWQGEEIPCDEGDLAWVEKSRIPSLPLWEGDRIFLDLIARNAPFFSLKLSYRGDRLFSAELDGTPLSGG